MRDSSNDNNVREDMILLHITLAWMLDRGRYALLLCVLLMQAHPTQQPLHDATAPETLTDVARTIYKSNA